MINIFRADKTNAGDWWSPPIRYFKFKNAKAIDILNCHQLPNDESIFIVGGGGLGRPFFQNHLNWLKRQERRYRLISWGAGCDTVENRVGTTDAVDDPIGGYFNDFDDNGLRIFPESQIHRWVPCSSCMWKGFDSFRSAQPAEQFGLYEHKRVSISSPELLGYPKITNDGDSIEQKLAFMSRFETIITNSYHGVYWATLLNRKVICIPFKSGLHTFKHKPAYLVGNFAEIRLNDVANYPSALEECRDANVDFFKFIATKYSLSA